MAYVDSPAYADSQECRERIHCGWNSVYALILHYFPSGIRWNTENPVWDEFSKNEEAHPSRIISATGGRSSRLDWNAGEQTERLPVSGIRRAYFALSPDYQLIVS
jgi:hypothetical protein